MNVQYGLAFTEKVEEAFYEIDNKWMIKGAQR